MSVMVLTRRWKYAAALFTLHLLVLENKKNYCDMRRWGPQ